MFSSKPALVVFLEKDNVKLVAAKIKNGKSQRVYAGQISMPTEVLRDAFIADNAKFSAQLRMALSQKEVFLQTDSVYLVLPAEKTFLKTLEPGESVDSFLHTLPFFKEELLLQSVPSGKEASASVLQTAFEKKLVGDLQQPFLESGKKVAGVFSNVALLGVKYLLAEDYFFMMGLDRTVSVTVIKQGKFARVDSWDMEGFSTRFIEFVHGQKLENIRKIVLVGNVSDKIKQDLSSNLGVQFMPMGTEDIYDQIISCLPSQNGFTFPKFGFPKLSLPENFPLRNQLSLIGAMAVGFILGWVVLSAVSNSKLPLFNSDKNPIVTQVQIKQSEQTTPAPDTKPASPPAVVKTPAVKKTDLKIQILNGTLVTGEAGRLSDKVKDAGYSVFSTKNASKNDYSATLLRLSDKFSVEMVAELKTLLEATYETVELDKTPPSASSVDGEIIIGRKK